MEEEIARLKAIKPVEKPKKEEPAKPEVAPILQRMTIPDYIEADKIMKAFLAKRPCEVPFQRAGSSWTYKFGTMNVWLALSKPDKNLWVKTHGIEHPIEFKEFLRVYEADMAVAVVESRKPGAKKVAHH